MKNRKFIISISSNDTTSVKLFIDTLALNEVNWWHWFPNTWFLIDTKQIYTTETISKVIMSKFPKRTHFIVTEVDVISWHGFGPNEKFDPKTPSKKVKNIFNWLIKNWK